MIIAGCKSLQKIEVVRLLVRVIALERQKIMFVAVFSQYLENYSCFIIHVDVDRKKLSIVEMIIMIRPTKSVEDPSCHILC